MHHPNEPLLTDRIVSGLYHAAAGERPWGEPLAGMVRLFDAWGVHLHGVNRADGSVAFSYEVGPGFTPQGALEYITRYHRIDPRTALMTRGQTGEWMRCHEHFDDTFVASDPFYRDFLMAYGGRYVSASKVYQDDEVIAFLGIHRGQGTSPLDADELALGQRLGEHVRNALGLWRRQRRVLLPGLVGNALLARLGHPVVLIDEQLQVHFANEAAQHLLRNDRRLGQAGNTLTCRGRIGAKDLLLALRRLRLGGEQSYLEAGPARHRAVVRASDREDGPSLVLLLSALRPAETMGVFGPRNLAMILIHDPGCARRSDPFIVAAIYDLTPAESAVAVAVADGTSVRQIARNHGVAVSTVRTQLSAVFAKMGVAKQAELAGALAAIPAFGGVPT